MIRNELVTGTHCVRYSFVSDDWIREDPSGRPAIVRCSSGQNSHNGVEACGARPTLWCNPFDVFKFDTAYEGYNMSCSAVQSLL